MKHRPPAAPQHPDALIEEIRRTHHEAIVALQKHIATLAPVVIKNVELTLSVETKVPHKLGREPQFVRVSAPRQSGGGGAVFEVTENVDRTKFIILRADNFSTDVVVDLEIR